jgi:hypothetical protein
MSCRKLWEIHREKCCEGNGPLGMRRFRLASKDAQLDESRARLAHRRQARPRTSSPGARTARGCWKVNLRADWKHRGSSRAFRSLPLPCPSAGSICCVRYSTQRPQPLPRSRHRVSNRGNVIKVSACNRGGSAYRCPMRVHPPLSGRVVRTSARDFPIFQLPPRYFGQTSCHRLGVRPCLGVQPANRLPFDSPIKVVRGVTR